VIRRSWSANTTGSGFNKPSQTPHHPPASPRRALCVCCVLLCCTVLSLLEPSSATLRALIVCCAFLFLSPVPVTGWLLACVWSIALPHPSSIACPPASPIASHLEHLEQKLGSKTEHSTCSHIVAKHRQHGVCLAAAHPLSIPHVLTLLAANLEALATSSTRVAVAKQNSMLLAAAPSVHTRRTAGSIIPGGVEYIHTRPTR